MQVPARVPVCACAHVCTHVRVTSRLGRLLLRSASFPPTPAEQQLPLDATQPPQRERDAELFSPEARAQTSFLCPHGYVLGWHRRGAPWVQHQIDYDTARHPAAQAFPHQNPEARRWVSRAQWGGRHLDSPLQAVLQGPARRIICEEGKAGVGRFSHACLLVQPLEELVNCGGAIEAHHLQGRVSAPGELAERRPVGLAEGSCLEGARAGARAKETSILYSHARVHASGMSLPTGDEPNISSVCPLLSLFGRPFHAIFLVSVLFTHWFKDVLPGHQIVERFCNSSSSLLPHWH